MADDGGLPTLPSSYPPSSYLERIVQPALGHTFHRINVRPQFVCGRIRELQKRLAVERVGHDNAALGQGPATVDWGKTRKEGREGGEEGG